VSDDFDAIEGDLRSRGISAYRQRPNQLVISRQHGAPWPDRGNSFWICKLAGDWYICTWAPHYYRVPSASSVVAVCEAFVDVGDSAQRRVPADLVTRFSLVETDHDEFDGLWDAARPAL
jgi:hypothetical protein